MTHNHIDGFSIKYDCKHTYKNLFEDLSLTSVSYIALYTKTIAMGWVRVERVRKLHCGFKSLIYVFVAEWHKMSPYTFKSCRIQSVPVAQPVEH